ncbi:MAG TPA: DUF4214 domain-containing protein [Pyrinomonadaceae bacterium]|jgi:hypothetical protein
MICHTIRRGPSSRRFFFILASALALIFSTASRSSAQCPTIDNHGWTQGATVRFFLDANLSAEQKRQIRIAIGEWNNANSVNNSRVRFEEDTTGTNFVFRFLNGTLPVGTPAFANKSFNSSGRVVSATLTYDPNAVFPGSSDLIINPSRAGYDTIFIKLTLHEMGHTMGLDHPAAPANICDQINGATVMNYICNENDLGGNLPTSVAACDQNAINSESIYPPTVPPTPTLQFSAGAYGASEGAGRLLVTVTRTGDASAAATASFATSDTAGLNSCALTNGVASSRCDYATSVGTVRFAAGETSKNISIPLVDDVYVEGSENFTLTLTSASGANLGAQVTATLTIDDNDTAQPTTNPIDQTPFFVRQHYIDFLNREPDPTGFAAWVHRIDFCGQPGEPPPPCDRVEVSSAFYRSPEFRERGYFVYKFYAASLGRFPRYAEFIPDLAKVSGFQTPEEQEANKQAFVIEFTSRAEFQNRYAGTTNTEYVDRILATAAVTSPNRQTWINELNAGTKTRSQVLREIAESAEVDAKFFNQAFVVMQYFGYLRRDPDALYLKWIETMDQTGDYRLMVNGFVNSAEYRGRFGP